MNIALSNQIKIDVQDAYGSISSPNWSFAEKRYAIHPYVRLMEMLSEFGTTQETTDLNDDVSVVVCIEFDDGDSITVRLSLVGKYACVSDSVGTFLSQDSMNEKNCIYEIISILHESNIVILQREDIIQQIDFCGNLATVYEVLFSADEAVG